MDPQNFYTHSLRNHPQGKKIVNILSAAIEAVDPSRAVLSHLMRCDNKLQVHNATYDLDQFHNIYFVAFGKASYPMSLAVKEVLGKDISRGIVITKSRPAEQITSDPCISIYQGSHPVPDQSSITGTREIVQLLSETTSTDLVIFLISGGGSALLTLPVEDITLKDIQEITNALLRCGATINEINCIRKHLSQVKGGGLARLSAPSQVLTLILSDVVADPLDVIASGPTVPDPTTFSEAKSILQKYKLIKETPPRILKQLNQGIKGIVPETPKEDDPIFNHVNNIIVGNNYQAANAAKLQAQEEGFNTILLSTALQGEARFIGPFLASIAHQVSKTGDPISPPACIIAGGESTVTISGDGFGGRNQEVALSTVTSFSTLEDAVFISMATDGDDGPTDAAGAVVTPKTFWRANSLGMDPEAYLARNDSYHYFDPLGDLLKPGITETNVCDLNFIFVF